MEENFDYHGLETRVVQLEKDSERNSNQHREFYDKFGKIDTKVAVTDERYSNILATLENANASIEQTRKKIDEMSIEPAKKWNNLIACLISGTVSIILGYLLGGLF